MPDCVGIPKNSAIEQIVRKFGPEITKEDIEIIEEFNENHTAGMVYDCIPQIGDEVDVENDTITLYVSKGKKMKMPMVIDKTESEARELLKAEGIRFNVEYVNSDREVGIVIDTSVPEGMDVYADDLVTIKVSKKDYTRPEKKENNQQEDNDSDTTDDSDAQNNQDAGGQSNEVTVPSDIDDSSMSHQTPSGDTGLDSLLGMGGYAVE